MSVSTRKKPTLGAGQWRGGGNSMGIEQEAEVVAGIARFVRGGSYQGRPARALALTIGAGED